MSNIEWGPERECTGEQPCPDWVLVQQNRREGPYWSASLPAKNVDWNRAVQYRLPAAYEALKAAKEPTHEQMLETLAAHYEGIPEQLVEIDPVRDIYRVLNFPTDWENLRPFNQEKYRAIFKAGQEHGK